jgi:hypothetical protein
MLRHFWQSLAVPAAMTALVLGTSVWAQAPQPRGPRPGAPAGSSGSVTVTAAMAVTAGDYLTVPGYWLLGMANVQKEVGLADQQRQKLKAISDKYQAAMRQLMEPLRDLPPQEQEQRMEAVRDKSFQQMEMFRKQVEAVLTAQQIEALKKIDFQLRAPALLSDSGVVEKLGLSARQQEKVREVQDEMTQKMQQIQREMAGKYLGVLTPEQQAKLRQMSETPPR